MKQWNVCVCRNCVSAGGDNINYSISILPLTMTAKLFPFERKTNYNSHNESINFCLSYWWINNTCISLEICLVDFFSCSCYEIQLVCRTKDDWMAFLINFVINHPRRTLHRRCLQMRLLFTRHQFHSIHSK